jgi:hypothetical protein
MERAGVGGGVYLCAAQPSLLPHGNPASSQLERESEASLGLEARRSFRSERDRLITEGGHIPLSESSSSRVERGLSVCGGTKEGLSWERLNSAQLPSLLWNVQAPASPAPSPSKIDLCLCGRAEPEAAPFLLR